MKDRAGLFNALTALVLGLNLLVCLGVGLIFANPQISFNPFKPRLDLAAQSAGPTVPTTPAAIADPISLLTGAATATVAPTSTPVPPTTAASSPTEMIAVTLSTASHTPFPSPLAPTVTLTPSEVPTRTLTPPPPSPAPTTGPYPYFGTDTPVPDIGTPGTAYP